MGEISKLQEQMNAWHNRNFQPESVLRNQLNLTEETGELSRAIVKMAQGVRGTELEWRNEAAKEIGDVFISLMNVAGSLGIDADEAINARWEVISKRDWVKDPIQHGISNE